MNGLSKLTHYRTLFTESRTWHPVLSKSVR